MIVVDRGTIEGIRSARQRVREIKLPVRYGQQRERRKCQAREGRAVKLVARVSYREHRERAEAEPTRARAVLLLIELCSGPRLHVTVTPTSVERDGDAWLVRFVKGDQAIDDEDVFLRPAYGYTIGRDELDAGVVMYQSADAMSEARIKAREKRDLPTNNAAAALKLAHRKLAGQKHAMNIRQRRQLDRVGKAIGQLAEELALDSSAIFDTSDRAQSPTAAESDGEAESRGQGDVRPAP